MSGTFLQEDRKSMRSWGHQSDTNPSCSQCLLYPAPLGNTEMEVAFIWANILLAYLVGMMPAWYDFLQAIAWKQHRCLCSYLWMCFFISGSSRRHSSALHSLAEQGRAQVRCWWDLLNNNCTLRGWRCCKSSQGQRGAWKVCRAFSQAPGEASASSGIWGAASSGLLCCDASSLTSWFSDSIVLLCLAARSSLILFSLLSDFLIFLHLVLSVLPACFCLFSLSVSSSSPVSYCLLWFFSRFQILFQSSVNSRDLKVILLLWKRVLRANRKAGGAASLGLRHLITERQLQIWLLFPAVVQMFCMISPWLCDLGSQLLSCKTRAEWVNSWMHVLHSGAALWHWEQGKPAVMSQFGRRCDEISTNTCH